MPDRGQEMDMLARIAATQDRKELTILVYRMRSLGFIDEAGEFTAPRVQRLLHSRFDRFIEEEKAASNFRFKQQHAANCVPLTTGQKDRLVEEDRERTRLELEREEHERLQSQLVRARQAARDRETLFKRKEARIRQIAKDVAESRARAQALVNEQMPLSDSRQAPSRGAYHQMPATSSDRSGYRDTQIEIRPPPPPEHYHLYVTQPAGNDCDHDDWEAEAAEFGNPEIFCMVPLSFNYEMVYTKNNHLTTLIGANHGYSNIGNRHETYSPYW